MFKSSSSRPKKLCLDSILFILPGCNKCKKAESKLRELGVSYQVYNIFEHRALFQSVPVENKNQGLPLLKMKENYYSLNEVLEWNKQPVSLCNK
ncbi:glutaredoxin domain-containing protein [Planococcus donghaensis]|uniref:Glutaredoxin n=1 Tax=Planococcus donghaensis TaxID=414778 RepID=A0A1C7EGI4_9BACL|nr:glutaredoxin domain-containing protein [Planococcus donghaensis]ANU23094.1 glutaredoxin [Planococcus donghaensis]